MKDQSKPQYSGNTFDSFEELYFYWWAEELMEAEIVEEIRLHPKSFELSSNLNLLHKKPMKKVEDKILEHTLLNKHDYTTDFQVTWTKKAENILWFDLNSESIFSKEQFKLVVAKDMRSYIEVKPSFDQNNMTRLAVLNQKWVYSKFGEFVNIVIPEKLFDKTFTPKNYLLTNVSKKERKIKYKNVVSLSEFLEINTK